MKFFKYISILGLLLIQSSLFAQKERFVFVANDFTKQSANSVHIKWFAPALISREGFNIYRKNVKEADFQKINSNPIRFSEQIEAAYQISETATSYHSAYKQVTDRKVLLDVPFLYVNAAILAVKENQFAQVLGIYYIDQNAQRGEQYIYKITELVSGIEVTVGESLPIVVGIFKKQPEPSQFSLVRRKTEVDIKWQVNLESYFTVDIFKYDQRKTSRNKLNDGAIPMSFKEMTGKPEKMYEDANIDKDSTYHYQLVGIDYFGNETEPTTILTAASKNFDLPLPAYGLRANADNLDIRLSWKIQKSPILEGFNVYRSVYFDSAFVQVNNRPLKTTDTLYRDKVSKPGEYFYRVGALGKDSTLSMSSPAIIDVRDVVPPGIPRGLEAKLDSGVIVLKWDTVSAPDLMGYYVLRAPLGSDQFVSLNTVALKSNTYREKLAKNVKTTFQYRVISVDSSFNKSAFAKTVNIRQPDVIPPRIPAITEVKASGKAIKVTWIPNTDNDFKYYTIYRRHLSSSDTTFVPLQLGIKQFDTTYFDNTIKNNNTYSYVITATDSANLESGRSKPYPYKYIDVTPTMSLKSFNAEKGKKKGVLLTWNIEKGNDFNGVIVMKKNAEDKEFNQISGKIDNEIQFIDNKVKEGSKLEYKILLYDKVGNVLESNIKRVDL
jgi:fibronectin type 3 domain-containing protein